MVGVAALLHLARWKGARNAAAIGDKLVAPDACVSGSIGGDAHHVARDDGGSTAGQRTDADVGSASRNAEGASDSDARSHGASIARKGGGR